jgi:serine/threonine-protein kinase RsbW
MIQRDIIKEVVFSSSYESLCLIEKFVNEIFEEYQLKEELYGNILIALSEAVNNAITHGNKLNPKKKVNLNVVKCTKEVSFIIKDEGAGFDYDKVPDPTLPENLEKLRGRGIFLMRNLADDVDFEENGKTIKLKFSVSAN